MALIFLDGFDKYGPANSNGTLVQALLTAGEWTSTSGTLTLVAPLSATGFAVALGSNAGAFKTLTANYTRLIGGFRFASSLAASAGFQFYDVAGSLQAGIQINTGGLFVVRNGDFGAGTILGTSTASVSANTTHYLEFDITFANAGSYQLWLDGVSILSGSGDTTATANQSATQISFRTAAAANITFDDLYLFDTTGTTNNAVLLTSPRIETQFPNGDGAVQFAVGAAVVGNSVSTTGTNGSASTNDMRLKSVTPGVSCTLQSISIVAGTASLGSASLRPVVYADSAGVPGALLGSGSTAAGPAASSLGTLPLTTPVALTAGTPYWIGFMFSTGVGSGLVVASGQDRVATVTFASGAPATAPAMVLQAASLMFGTVTVAAGAGNNWWCVSQNPTQGSQASGFGNRSYVYDATVGHEDLYTYPALSAPPSAIYAVAVKASVAKSDAGAKTVSVRCKSGATDSAGTGGTAIAPAATHGWLTSHFPTDPATGSAWTLTALNAAQAGLKVET